MRTNADAFREADARAAYNRRAAFVQSNDAMMVQFCREARQTIPHQPFSEWIDAHWEEIDAAAELAGGADREYASRIDAERVTLQFARKSTRRLDTGKVPIEESPLFGGPRQTSLFNEDTHA